MQQQTAAGWYADPWQQATFRWWDGFQWTRHVNTAAPEPEEPAQAEPDEPGFFGRAVSGIRARREENRRQADERRARSAAHRRPASSSWLQMPSLMPAFEQGQLFDVVGESHYQPALLHAAIRKTIDGPMRPLVTAQLVAEPTNVHDPHAVQVLVEGDCVGYIPRDSTGPFRQMLGRFESAGTPATARAWITGGWHRAFGDEGHFGMKLDLDQDLRPMTEATPFLPGGRTVTVVGEEHCQDYLAPLLSAPSLVATLELSDGDPLRPKVTGECLIVKVDSTQVGGLTPAMCERHMPLVRAVAAAGMPATCHAAVERGKKKLEVSLWLQHPDKVLEGSGG